MPSLVNQLENWVIPQTISSGCFGIGAEFESYEIDNFKCEAQFASEIMFVKINVKLPEENNCVKSFKVVVKFQLQDEVFRKVVNTKFQFENEILMYSKILPVLDNGNGCVQELFCRYFHGYVDPNEEYSKDFVVLEDLRQYGYGPSTEKVFLDFEHCSLILHELGRFHALSYILKQDNNFDRLLSEASKIKEKFTETTLVTCKYLFEYCGKRGVNAVIDSGQHVDLLESYLKNYEDPVRYFQNLVEPTEPGSILCHGDFNRNNICFKYDENQKVVSVKFIDLQTPRYCSPIIDLSFFLYMNTTAELRDKHWNDLIDTYNQAVISTASLSKAPELDWTKAVYGYIHCSYFLPAMTVTVKPETEEMWDDDPKLAAMSGANLGSERETKLLADIVRHLVENGFLKASYI